MDFEVLILFQGILFSAHTPHILMLGNPILYWMIATLLIPVLALLLLDAVKCQRGKAYQAGGALPQCQSYTNIFMQKHMYISILICICSIYAVYT